MNTKLITALRTAASALDAGTFHYNWFRPESCNCGVVVCSLLGKSVSQLQYQLPTPLYDKGPSWKVLVGQYCPVTGIPENEIFRELMKCGLTQRDITSLETLSDASVIARMGDLGTWAPKRKWYQLRSPSMRPRTKLDYGNQKDAANYMRAWAQLLEEQGRADSADVEQCEPATAP